MVSASLTAQRETGNAAAPGAAAVPAVVLGTSITALGVLRSFGRSQIPAYAVTQRGDLPTLSRWYRPLPGGEPGAPGPEALRAVAAAIPGERAVLVPCTDRWVEAVSALRAELAPRCVSSLAPAEAIAALLDKGSLASLAAETGVPHPRTAVLRRPEDLDALESWDFSRAFLKPRSSARFLERYRVKGLRVASLEEARRRLREIAAEGIEVLLQEYVPGPADHHYFIDGFLDAGGRARALFARRRLRMFPADFGNSTLMESVPVAEVEAAWSALARLLARVSYRGIFSAEFKRDPRDGAFRLLEVNVRPWWYVEFAETSGVGVVELAYRDALGLPLRDGFRYRAGRRCVYPYFDRAAVAEARLRREAGVRAPGWLGAAANWLTASQPVFAWDDPAPAMHNLWMVTKRSLGNLVNGGTK